MIQHILQKYRHKVSIGLFLEDLFTTHNISGPCINWRSHVRFWHGRHVGIVGGRKLKVQRCDALHCLDVHTNFNENPSTVSY
jgi:hypothetical protein